MKQIIILIIIISIILSPLSVFAENVIWSEMPVDKYNTVSIFISNIIKILAFILTIVSIMLLIGCVIKKR